MKYTLILQNNGSKQEYLITGLIDVSPSTLAYVFEDFEFPGQPGEYTGILFQDSRNDSVYTLKDDPLKTTVETAEGTVEVFRLRPEVFLLKYGSDKCEVTYLEKNENYFYYER